VEILDKKGSVLVITKKAGLALSPASINPSTTISGSCCKFSGIKGSSQEDNKREKGSKNFTIGYLINID
jgi:hypothetical protein